jgi:CheY-like chemotaxis protein
LNSSCIKTKLNGKIVYWHDTEITMLILVISLRSIFFWNNIILLGWSVQMKVLIVDDEEETVDYLESLLCSASTDVDIFRAFNGAQALELCSKIPFDLICTDIAMPVMDGLDFAANLRGTEGPNQDTGIILISGVIDQTPSECDMFQGMFFLSKPFQVSTFHMTVSLASKVPSDKGRLKARSPSCKKAAGASD